NYKGYLDQLVPTLVGNLVQSAASTPGIFDPPHAAYKAIGTSTLTFNVDFGLDLSLGGLSLTTPVYTSTFTRATSNALTLEFVKSVMEQPMVRSNAPSTCTQTWYWFNETYVDEALSLDVLPADSGPHVLYRFANPFQVRGNLQSTL
ncbi:hypothetical protein OC842_007816, partial [Tilletia horrida]